MSLVPITTVLYTQDKTRCIVVITKEIWEMKRSQFKYNDCVFVIYRITSFGEVQCVNLSTGALHSFFEEAFAEMEVEVVEL